MNKFDVNSVIIPPGPNFFYLTGFETESMERLAALIVTDSGITAIVPELMRDQLLENSWLDDLVSWNDSQDPYSLLKTIIPGGRIAIDGGLPYLHYRRIRNVIEGDELLADDLTVSLRMKKDEHELAAIAEAVHRSEAALEDLLDILSVGMTEVYVAKKLDDLLTERGLQGAAFNTIVASGPNSAMPHHVPGDRKLSRGDAMIIDFGGRYYGYASDITRTFFIGYIPDEFRTIYDTVRKANETARDSMQPGTEYQAADAAARNVISKSGYGKFFIHRLGHGLGISVHEDPYLVAGNNSVLQKDTVFTIEPGIYIPGKGGVRIEDTNYFDGKSCIAFNDLTRDPTVI